MNKIKPLIFSAIMIILVGTSLSWPTPASIPLTPTSTPLLPTPTAASIPATTPTTSVIPAPSSTSLTPPSPTPSLLNAKFFFDDFTYTDQQTMTANGWIIREKAGWPGMPQASWSKDNVSFIDDPNQSGNRLVQMVASTDGTAAGTHQTQFCHQRKYFEGTYAARLLFSDTPAKGPDGDQLVETFYMISPLEAPMDPDFSEMDNEYLPNGGWDNGEHTFFVTTWETAQIEPWKADNTSDSIQRSMADWHTLIVQVLHDRVNYLGDGTVVASHGGKYYPDVPMSINYNLWFIDGGLLKSREVRQYNEYVDWVYFEADTLLTPQEVETRVNALRGASIPFHDSVPAGDPPLPSPCDL